MPAGGPHQPSGRVPCPVCSQLLESRHHRGQHIRRVHGAPPTPKTVTVTVATVTAEPPPVPSPQPFPPRASGPLLTRFLIHVRPECEAVPDAAKGLPWVRFSRRPEVCERVVTVIDTVVTSAETEAERAFWESLGAYIIAIAERIPAA